MSARVTAILEAGRVQSGPNRGSLEYDVNEELMAELNMKELHDFKLVLMRAMQRLMRDIRARPGAKTS